MEVRALLDAPALRTRTLDPDAAFDRTDYRPVYLDNRQRGGSVVRTRVITYEELSITPENQALLSITAQHPGASVDPGQRSAATKPK